MTDGTTAIPVGPITEDDMSKVHDILRRAADAIVGMSQLKIDVDTLRQQVAQLSDDAERLRKSNAGLEESLWQARNQRQELEAKLAEATQAMATAQREAEDWQHNANNATAKAQSLGDELASTKHDRDEAQLKVMELEDSLKSATDKLAKVKEIFGISPEAVQPKPEAPASEPVPMPTLESTPPPGRRYLDQWEPGSSWDENTHRYYVD